MPLRYFHPNDEDQLAAQAPIGFDEDDHWWVGVQRCAATIAIAATLTITSLSTAQARTQATGFYHQDDPQLFGQPDEDFWQNQVAPVPATLLWPQQWAFDVQEPAGSLFGQPDEDYWQNWVAPVPATFYQPLPYLPDPEELPAASLVVPLPIDELYWQNPVAPVQATLYQPLPLLPDVEELPAAFLFGQPDEDYWVNPVPPVWSYPSVAFRDDDTIVPQPAAFNLDEDFWWNPVAPVRAAFGALYLPDSEEVPAGALFGQADEDYWRNWVAPQRWAPPLVAFSDDEITVPQPVLAGQIILLN